MITLILAMALSADQAAAVAAPVKPLSAQAQFDGATAAAHAGRWAEALRGFEAIEAKPATKRNPAVLAAVLVRKGSSLLALGRIEEAEVALRVGLRGLPVNAASSKGDRYQAHYDLGRIDYRNFEYASALREFELASALAATPQDNYDALVSIVRASMFDEGSIALAASDRAMALAKANPNASKKLIADVLSLRARARLNHGDAAGAYAELKQALVTQGGLTTRVTIADIVTRSDLALAALLTKDTENARRYLAYTGAGRTVKTPFTTAVSMSPPPCGGAAGLKPDDVAVIEFGLKDDGSVSYSTPVYASRLGPMALTFARAVADWSWTPENAKSIPQFFRLATRVELRCSTSAERPSISDVLASDLEKWLESRGATIVNETDQDAKSLPMLVKELARREAASSGVALVPVLIALGQNRVASSEDRARYFARASEIASGADAPLAARLYLDVQLLSVEDRARWSNNKDRKRLRALLAKYAPSNDVRAMAALRLLVSDPAYRSPAPADASALLSAVVADKRLPERDALRVAALVRLAALQAAAGDVAAAQASYQQTGLDAQQCALVDVAPVLRRSGASGSDFPMEAARWGFEGWVRTEYDIQADGKTMNQRAIIAYPPFIFRDAAVGVAKDMRYQQSYRPDGGLGCGGKQQNIRFEVPPSAPEPF